MTTTHEPLVYRPVAAQASPWLKLLVAIILLVMLLPVWAGVRAVWGVSTLRYELTRADLVIHYGPTVERIPRAAILKVTQLTPSRGRRTMGTGLPGLQHGRWTFTETGPIYMYSTSTAPLTVLETATGRFGISPADPAGLQAALASGGTGTFAPAPAQHGWSMAAFLFAALVLPVGLALLLLYLMRMPSVMTYTLDTEALAIRPGFGKVTVPYEQIRAVELASPPGFPVRVFGAGLPGLQWGAFHWPKAGRSLRLYTTRIKPLVLVRTDRRTFGLTPEDGERFVAELSRRIGG